MPPGRATWPLWEPTAVVRRVNTMWGSSLPSGEGIIKIHTAEDFMGFGSGQALDWDCKDLMVKGGVFFEFFLLIAFHVEFLIQQVFLTQVGGYLQGNFADVVAGDQMGLFKVVLANGLVELSAVKTETAAPNALGN